MREETYHDMSVTASSGQSGEPSSTAQLEVTGEHGVSTEEQQSYSQSVSIYQKTSLPVVVGYLGYNTLHFNYSMPDISVLKLTIETGFNNLKFFL